MKRTLTQHEYQINGGDWIGCTTGNTTDNSDGTYTIHDGLNTNIAIGDLKVRVKALGMNAASMALENVVAFNAAGGGKVIQLFTLGDSITRGIGTTSSGFAATGGVYGGSNSWPQQMLAGLSALNVTLVQRGWTGRTTAWFNANDLDRTIAMFDKTNYTDIYAIVFFNVNDLTSSDVAPVQSSVTTACAALQGAGAKVLLVTAIDMQNTSSDPTTYNSRRATYNTWLLANYATIADGLVDLTGYHDIFDVGAANNATYFADAAHDISGAGKIHPTDAGAALIAAGAIDAVISLASTSSRPITAPNEAADFITATGISDNTIISAIETLVTDLKAAKIWWKLRALYPLVGGTTSTHKFNLRNPIDTDAAFRLSYTGSATHDANGVTWVDGAYADTHFIQVHDDDFEASNISLHYYSRTNAAGGIDIGAFDTWVCWFSINTGGDTHSQLNNYSGANGLPYSNYSGLFSVCRDNEFTENRLYRNGSLVAAFNEQVQNTPMLSLTLGINNGGLNIPSNRNCSYAAIGYGLTAAEEAAHYTIIQAFQTALGRAV